MRAVRVKNASAWPVDLSSSGAVPTVASGPAPIAPSRQSEAETNGCAGEGPTEFEMNCLNLCMSPPVASASSAAEASGVWIEGSASESPPP